MPEPQSFKNHSRFDPKFHFFIAPVLLANFIVAIVYACHHCNDGHCALHIWLIVVSLAMLMTAGIARGYGLAVQDRVIRLEERLRYASLLTPAEIAAAQALTIKQTVALRFASDAELPVLVKRAVTESLTPKAIKQSITTWRADYQRV